MRLAYDGTNFVGSQWQRTGRSVQGEMETAWLRLTQEPCRFTFSGRTDAGVHAQGQVVHVQTNTRHTTATIQRALNALVPDDMAILEVWEALPGFHARYSAHWRWYRYILDTERVALPTLRRYVVHLPRPLDETAMQAALTMLLGTHDFAAFTSIRQSGSTVRTCLQATCGRIELFQRSLLAIDLVANAFLRHMVRTIVGTLLLVGYGHLTPAEFEQIREGRDRRQAGATAAAHGLTLMAVGYPEDR